MTALLYFAVLSAVAALAFFEYMTVLRERNELADRLRSFRIERKVLRKQIKATSNRIGRIHSAIRRSNRTK